jgi:hypothetical protein
MSFSTGVCNKINKNYIKKSSDRSVGIATGYELDVIWVGVQVKLG